MTTFDLTSVQDAILATDACGLAKEEGARLVQAYIEHYADHDAATFKVLDVERPWHLWLDEWTLLVGCKDGKLQDAAGPLLLELKTKREARRTKAGEWYKGEGPEAWLEGISNGPQLGIYALHEVETTGAEYARIMVRAIVKSTPPVCWPPNEADGIFILNRDYLQHLKSALLVRAKQVRASKMSGLVPWDWLAYRCTHMYGKTCQFYEECKAHIHPVGDGTQQFSKTDPGAQAIEEAFKERGWMAEDAPAELVILSASAYEDYTQCFERGRRIQHGLGEGDESMELQIGSCFHAGIAAFNRLLGAQQ